MVMVMVVMVMVMVMVMGLHQDHNCLFCVLCGFHRLSLPCHVLSFIRTGWCLDIL